MKTTYAVRSCASWLRACLSYGWRKEDLEMLESLWWKYHDDNGRFIEKGERRAEES